MGHVTANATLEINLFVKYSGARPFIHLKAITTSLKYSCDFTGIHFKHGRGFELGTIENNNPDKS